jgi:hypothetical protein
MLCVDCFHAVETLNTYKVGKLRVRVPQPTCLCNPGSSQQQQQQQQQPLLSQDRQSEAVSELMSRCQQP